MMLEHWLARWKFLCFIGTENVETGRTSNLRIRRSQMRRPSNAGLVQLLEDRVLLSALGTSLLVEGPSAGTDSDIVMTSGAWTASTTDSWITLNTTSGTGNGAVNFSFTADTGATRSGTVTIAGQTLTVTQAGIGYVPAVPTTLVPAILDGPTGVAVDSAGNVFIADAYHNTIQKWNAATGTVSSLASAGLALNPNSAGLAVDSSGNLYIPDSNGIQKWNAATGNITHLISTGLNQPYGVAVDTSGNVYIADSGNNAIKKWTASTGTVTTLVSVGLGDPTGIAVDGVGNVYFSDTNNNAIKEWHASTGMVTTLVSTGFSTFSGVAVDGSGNVYFADASFNNSLQEWHVATGTVTTLVSSGLSSPAGLAVDSSGNVFIADRDQNAIKTWHPSTQSVTTLVSSVLAFPAGTAVDSSGNVYIADTKNNAIKEWNAATGMITTLVSSGLNGPGGVAVDGSGNVYIADTSNNAIKEWHAGTGTVTTLVSTGLSQPYGVAVDVLGNVYIADLLNNAIKEWNAVTTNVTTLVSTGLSFPLGVAVDVLGNVYIADSGHNAIRKWAVATQAITTLVSTGLNYPRGVAVDGSGNVYIADYNNFEVEEWTASTGLVTVLLSHGLFAPSGVAVDISGNVYIADTFDSAVKELPRVYVNTVSKSEPFSAGTDQLSVVVPQTANLTGVFAPISDQSWLTIGGVNNGVVNFSFAANTTGATRTAHITLLGQSIAVTQNLPAVTSPTVSIITSTSAILGGNVVSDGGSTITERGVLYSLTSDNPNPQIGGAGVTKVTANGTTGLFTVNATSLTHGAVYSFVAYATNSIGTTYTSPVSVFGVNLPPVLSNIESTPLAYKANDPAFPPMSITSTATVTDPDSNNLTKLTIQITSGYQNDANGQDVLAFTNKFGITGLFDASTGTLTLSGKGYLGNYREALRTVTFSTSGTNLNTANRTLTIVASDDGLPVPADSQPITRVVTISTANVPPTLTGVGLAPISYTNGTAAVAVAPSATIADSDSINLAGATIQITGNFQTGQDVLQAATAGTGITSTYDPSSGKLTLSGIASLANYQQVLRSVSYYTNSMIGSTVPRTVTFILNDGIANSTPVNAGINVLAFIFPPVIGSVESSPLAYKANNPAIPISNTVIITDPDSNNLTKLTVQITSGYQNDANGNDVLDFTNSLGITGSFDAASGTLTLTGTVYVGSYREALRSVTFRSTGPNVSSANRVLTIIATDDKSPTAGVSTPVSRSVVFNFPPVISGIEPSRLVYRANDPPLVISNTVTVTDPDSNNLTRLTVQITSGYQNDSNGNDLLGFTDQFGITGSFDSAMRMLTLSGNAYVGLYREALRSVTYSSTGRNVSLANRILTIVATDDGSPDSASSITVKRIVTALNLPPIISAIESAPLAYTGNNPPQAISKTVTLTDPDSDNLSKLTVQITSGYQNNANGSDVLDFTNRFGITGSFDAATGTLTLTGTSYIGNYREALRSVTFRSTGTNISTANRILTIIGSDDSSPVPGVSAPITRTIIVS